MFLMKVIEVRGRGDFSVGLFGLINFPMRKQCRLCKSRLAVRDKFAVTGGGGIAKRAQICDLKFTPVRLYYVPSTRYKQENITRRHYVNERTTIGLKRIETRKKINARSAWIYPTIWHRCNFDSGSKSRAR